VPSTFVEAIAGADVPAGAGEVIGVALVEDADADLSAGADGEGDCEQATNPPPANTAHTAKTDLRIVDDMLRPFVSWRWMACYTGIPGRAPLRGVTVGPIQIADEDFPHQVQGGSVLLVIRSRDAITGLYVQGCKGTPPCAGMAKVERCRSGLFKVML